MPSNYLPVSEVQEPIAREITGVKQAQTHVQFLRQMHAQMPSETSLASVYGATLCLAGAYERSGSDDAAIQILTKLKPMLFHLVEQSTSLDFDCAYMHVTMLATVRQYGEAKKIARKCISIIMKNYGGLCVDEKKALKLELEERFFAPITDREQMHQEALRISRQLKDNHDWFKASVVTNASGAALDVFETVWAGVMAVHQPEEEAAT